MATATPYRVVRRLPAALLAAALLAGGCGPAPDAPRTAVVVSGPLETWSVYDGRLEARRVELVHSAFNGRATIVELAPEGATVRQGDPLVRFDDSQVRRDVLRLERDEALARTDYEALEKAVLPLELRALEEKRQTAREELDAERGFLEESLSLEKDGLLSGFEVRQQKAKAERLAERADALDRELELTRTLVHPGRLAAARAKLDAASQELALARAQLDSCRVLSPSAGTVVYQPVSLGAEFRPVRVGDAVFQNQPFLALPDMTDLVARLRVPESELSLVEPGRPATVRPAAWPDLVLTGRVEKVGSMAQEIPGRTGGRRYFDVTVGLDRGDPRLRTGLSAEVRIQSAVRERCLQVPRAAVQWTDGRPAATVPTAAGPVVRALRLGAAGGATFEVLEGLQDGERVLLP